MKKRKRPYRKTARAEAEAETRDRIVEAVVALHEEVGPLRTTISGIAERAGVQRLTVYRHFPDEADLVAACSARWTERNPLPDPSAVVSPDPRSRARELLVRLYRYYRGTSRMLANVLADAPRMPVVARHVAPIQESLDELVKELDRGWPARSAARRATLAHAVQLSTWQSLIAVTRDDAAAADLVMRWCDGLA